MIERLVALAVLAAGAGYLASATPLPVGTAARPGAGFFPLAVGVFGTAVALAWVVVALRRPSLAAAAPVPAGGRRRVGATAALLVAFCLLLPRVGYPVVAFLFVALLLRALGSRWPSAVAIALATALVSTYVFGSLLGVPLPRGWLAG